MSKDLVSVDLDWVKRKYNEFNRRYFNNELPVPEFKIGRSKHFWGYASCSLNKELKKTYGYKVTISNYYISSERCKCNTLLHEMIHIKDFYCHADRYCRRRGYDSHGSWFLSEARRINRDGWDISNHVQEWEESESELSEYAKEKEERKRKEGYIIGFVKYSEFKDEGKAYFVFKTDGKHIEKYCNDYCDDWYVGKHNWERLIFYRCYESDEFDDWAVGRKIRGQWCSGEEMREWIDEGRMELVKDYDLSGAYYKKKRA